MTLQYLMQAKEAAGSQPSQSQAGSNTHAVAAADITAAALSIMQQLQVQPVASACGCDLQQQAALDAAVAELEVAGAVRR